MENQNPEETRACKNCRHWLSMESGNGQCRALPPQIAQDGELAVWPVTQEFQWCSKFNPAVGNPGSVSKVADETVIGIVRGSCEPIPRAADQGGDIPRAAYKRSSLVADLMELGMSRTPALKKIEKLVRHGRLQQGDDPWPKNGATQPGIHLWVNLEPVAPEKPADDEGQFLSLVRSAAFTPEGAMSLRAIHREIGPHLAISLATASRRMAGLVASGAVIKTDAGYYAPMIEVD